VAPISQREPLGQRLHPLQQIVRLLGHKSLLPQARDTPGPGGILDAI